VEEGRVGRSGMEGGICVIGFRADGRHCAELRSRSILLDQLYDLVTLVNNTDNIIVDYQVPTLPSRWNGTDGGRTVMDGVSS